MAAINLHEVRWIHGAPDCAVSTDPPLQIVAFDDDTFIVRQSKCVDFEGPFLYLLFGADAVLLHDTGAAVPPELFPLRQTVEKLIADRLAARGQTSIRRIITHSHGHGDHHGGNDQFRDLPPGSIAPPDAQGVAEFFGIANWPEGRGALDLGGRLLDVLPTPGHEEAHVMLFDRSRGLLLSGDMLYPGVLTVRDWRAYRRSVARLAAFCRETAAAGAPVVHVLGAHIEMTSTPGQAFPVPSEFQPNEHPLPLTAEHVFELDAALREAGDTPRRIARDSFIVKPLSPH